MPSNRNELDICKFIVAIPDGSRLKSVCPYSYIPIRGDVLTHRFDVEPFFMAGDFPHNVYYRFDSFYLRVKDSGAYCFYYSKEELLSLQKDGIIILLKNVT